MGVYFQGSFGWEDLPHHKTPLQIPNNIPGLIHPLKTALTSSNPESRHLKISTPGHRGEFYDGTPVENPQDLRRVLLKRPEPLVRNFTANLMAYALGRRVQYYDMPHVRAIVRDAEANGYRDGEQT